MTRATTRRRPSESCNDAASAPKRYLVHIAGFNLSLVLRKLLGFGTPRGFAIARKGLFDLRFILFVLLVSIRAVSATLLWQRHSHRSATPMPQDDIHQGAWWRHDLLLPVNSTP